MWTGWGKERAWLVGLGVFLAYLAIGVVFFWPVWTAGGATHMQIGGDQWRNVWFNEWTLRSITHGHNPFHSDAANYPGGVNVLINAGAPLLAFLFSPITAMFGPIAAYNVASTLALPLSAAAAYLLMRRFVEWRPAAFLGGLLYGFCPQEVVHGLGGHVNLSFSPLPPLIFLALYEVLIVQRWRFWAGGIGLGVLVSMQFFVSSEVLLETVLVAGISVVIAGALDHRSIKSHAPYAARSMGCAIAVALILLAWPAWMLAKGPGHVSGPVQLVAAAYRANLVSPVVPDSLQLITVGSLRATADHFASSPVENGSYLGLPLVLLLLIGIVWKRRDRLVLVAAIGGIAAFILSMGGAMTIKSAPALTGSGHALGKIPLPEALLEKLPLLENVVPARFALQVALFASLAGAILIESVYRSGVGRWRPGWKAGSGPVLLAAFAMLPLLPATLLTGVLLDISPSGFVGVASRIPAGGVAAVFPYPSGTFPNPIMWQVDSDIRFKMPGGSFFVPQGPDHRVAYSQLLGYTFDSVTGEVFTQLANGQTPPETPQTKSELAGEWSTWHLQTVLAVPSGCPHPDQAMQFLTWLLGTPDVHEGDSYGWYHVD